MVAIESKGISPLQAGKVMMRTIALAGLDWYARHDSFCGQVYGHSGVVARARDLVAGGSNPLSAFLQAGEEKHGSAFSYAQKAKYLLLGVSGAVTEVVYQTLAAFSPNVGRSMVSSAKKQDGGWHETPWL